jgi:hypothetical protein
LSRKPYGRKKNEAKAINQQLQVELDKDPIAKARCCLQDFKDADPLMTDLYSPTVAMVTFRLFLLLALLMGSFIDHIDFTTAFLNAAIYEDIYTTPLPDDKAGPGWGRKVLKSIYGYRKAPRNWYKMLANFLISLNLKRSEMENCLFYGHIKDKLVIVLVYVDDLLIQCADQSVVDMIKQKIAEKFRITDLGPLKRFLNVYVDYAPKSHVKLSQKHYAEEIAARYEPWCNIFKGCSMSTPLPQNYEEIVTRESVPDKGQGKQWFDTFPYLNIIGALLYLSLNTRPMITFAVNFLARFSTKPTYGACWCVAWLMSYVAGTTNHGIVYFYKWAEELYAMCDANWGGHDKLGRSTAGYMIFWAGGLLSWGSKLMKTIATSSMQAEYQAYYYCITDLVFIRSLMTELSIVIKRPFRMFSDAKSAIATALAEFFHAMVKHYLIKYHWIRQHLQGGIYPTVELMYLPTEFMVADCMTKQGTLEQFNYCKDVVLNFLRINEQEWIAKSQSKKGIDVRSQK